MQATRNTLKQDIKREVMAELQQQPLPGYSPYARPGYLPKYPYYNTSPTYHLSPQLYRPAQAVELESLKQEVMREVQDDLFDYGTTWPMPPVTNPYHRAIVDSVKGQMLAEIAAERTNHMAQTYGYGQLLSDQNINRAIGRRYRTLDQIRDEVRKELQAVNRLEKHSANTDPQILDIAHTIAWDARQQGVPLEEVIRRLNHGTGTGWWNSVSAVVNTGQRRGFLYGVGVAAIVALLWPSARHNLHSVAVRSLEEGMSLADRARSFVGRRPETTDTSFTAMASDNSHSTAKPEIDFIDQ